MKYFFIILFVGFFSSSSGQRNVISLGQHTYEFKVNFPEIKGNYYLTAETVSSGGRETTKSIRKIEIVSKK